MKMLCAALGMALLSTSLPQRLDAAPAPTVSITENTPVPPDPSPALDSAAAPTSNRLRSFLTSPASTAGATRSRAMLTTSIFSRAQSAAADGDFALAARLFSEVEGTDAPEDERLRAEIDLAHCLLALALFDAAIRQYDFVLRAGPNHPAYVEAIEGLLEVNALSGEDVLITAILDREYGEPFARLHPALLDEVNAIVGTSSLRAGHLEEARAFFDSVAPTAQNAQRVDYLAGLVAARTGEHGIALDLFERALKISGPQTSLPTRVPTTFASPTARLARQAAHERRGKHAVRLSAQELGELALLAKARTLYALGRFSESVFAYERIPRFSRFWETSLFENGWARLQNEDDGGALGTLQALHAPQFSGSFQPESWILKATIYFTHCLHFEARSALQAFDAIYGPQKEALRALLSKPHPLEFWIDILKADKTDVIPFPIQGELLANQRLLQLVRSLERIEEEERRIKSLEPWKGSAFLSAQLQALAQSADVARRVVADFVEKRLRDALARLIGFDAQKEILELEIVRVETEELEAHFDRSKALQSQSLHRPRLGNERQIYWPFQGEFWIDEIGHYQFTLKNGCRPTKP